MYICISDMHVFFLPQLLSMGLTGQGASALKEQSDSAKQRAQEFLLISKREVNEEVSCNRDLQYMYTCKAYSFILKMGFCIGNRIPLVFVRMYMYRQYIYMYMYMYTCNCTAKMRIIVMLKTVFCMGYPSYNYMYMSKCTFVSI